MAAPPLIGAPINTLPRGLLDFLGIKNMGANPRYLGNDVNSILDLWKFYRAQQERVVAMSGTSLAVLAGNGAGAHLDWAVTVPNDLTDGTRLTVPSNQIWWIEDYHARCTVNAVAGDFISLGLINEIPNVTVTVLLKQQAVGPTTGLATGTTMQGVQITEGFWAPPGSILRATTFGKALTAATTLAGYLRYVPLSI